MKGTWTEEENVGNEEDMKKMKGSEGGHSLSAEEEMKMGEEEEHILKG